MLCAIASYQLTEDTHPRLFFFTELDLENKVGIEASAVEKGIMPECDVIHSIVLPDRLGAVRTFDWDVGAWRVFC